MNGTTRRSPSGSGQNVAMEGRPSSAVKRNSEAHDEDARPSKHPRLDDSEWLEVDRATRRKWKKQAGNYPAITHSGTSRLNSFVKISDLQGLVLYLLADGPAPQWVSVRHHHNFDKVVVLMVPGLDSKLFDKTIPLDDEVPTIQEVVDVSKAPTENGHTHAEQEVAVAADGAGGNSETSKTSPRSSSQKMILPPDHFYPAKLGTQKLPRLLRPLVGMFSHIWPVKAGGDPRRMHSPMYAMLSSPIPKPKEDRSKKGPKPPPEGKGWKNTRTPITEFLATRAELLENGYAIHPAHLSTATEQEAEAARRYRAVQAAEDGWVDIPSISTLSEGAAPDSEIEAGSILQGRRVLVMDCEMVTTTLERFSLARVSLLDWDGTIILDELVKQPAPVKDYLTPFSGITKELLDTATMTLPDIQARLRELLTPRTILAGHSLDSDFRALKMSFPFVVDTALLYPHPKGPPQKSSLKWLTQKYLGREIQKSGSAGHDSVEDAKACLDLVRQKCERGKKWGTSEAQGESLFKRLGRRERERELGGVADTMRHIVREGKDEDDGRNGSNGSGREVKPGKTGAMVDWTGNMHGFGSSATVAVSCTSDEEVVAGAIRAITGKSDATATNDPQASIPDGGCDFTFARLRELEFVRGWSPALHPSTRQTPPATTDGAPPSSSGDTPSSSPAATTTTDPSTADLTAAVDRTVSHISKIYHSLPTRTAFIVFSGSGDPREMLRLQAMHAKHKAEFLTTKWDQLETQWTDVEEQALKKAVETAKKGVGFVGVSGDDNPYVLRKAEEGGEGGRVEADADKA